ncbi:hypothetical protein AB0M36_32250 [Actinoplanes sp. NPDC051346]|uniref:hypothetical protein n=1 Tax=Actinoplanes sp. NPDC051346 TaxID=3155048 RepID=UPI00342F829A
MTSIAIRALTIGAAAAIVGAAGASPAGAVGDSDFQLAVGRAAATGSYELVMSIPERPVPPVAVRGTLTTNGRNGCAVVQLAANGPADEIIWPTLTHLCGPGATDFQARSSYLFGGAKPPLRLCVGPTVATAESGRRCDVYTPSPDL